MYEAIKNIIDMQQKLIEEISLLSLKLQGLEKIIEVNERLQGKKIAYLESKVDQLVDGHVLTDDNGYVGYQHKVEIISRGIITTVHPNAKSELTIIKQDAERAAK